MRLGRSMGRLSLPHPFSMALTVRLSLQSARIIFWFDKLPFRVQLVLLSFTIETSVNSIMRDENDVCIIRQYITDCGTFREHVCA